MPSSDRRGPNTVLTPEVSEDMEKFGVIRVAVDYYHCGDFRYTNLRDVAWFDLRNVEEGTNENQLRPARASKA